MMKDLFKTMDLTDNDRQRIEQEANEIFYATGHSRERVGFQEGAEYATIFEREQQAKPTVAGHECEHYLLTDVSVHECECGRLTVSYQGEIKEYLPVQQLEAERREVRNKVIEEAIEHLNSPLLNFSDGLIYKGTVIEILNSLKTK